MKQAKNVLIVLGCALRRDGRPSMRMMSRVRKSIQLYKKNKYSLIVLTGGPVTHPVPEAEVMRLMIMHHVPENKIVVESNARTTIQNALFSWELIKDIGVKKVVVVTSCYHLKRTKYIFKKMYSHMGVNLKFAGAEDPFDLIDKFYYWLSETKNMIMLRITGIK